MAYNDRELDDLGIRRTDIPAIARCAPGSGVKPTTLTLFPENGGVPRMARRLGARLIFDQGVVEGRLTFAGPNHLTLLSKLPDVAFPSLAILRPAGP